MRTYSNLLTFNAHVILSTYSKTLYLESDACIQNRLESSSFFTLAGFKQETDPENPKGSAVIVTAEMVSGKHKITGMLQFFASLLPSFPAVNPQGGGYIDYCGPFIVRPQLRYWLIPDFGRLPRC